MLASMYLFKPSRSAFENWRAILEGNGAAILSELRDAVEEACLASDAAMEELLWEYTKLFIGPYKLPCPPWESVYTSPTRLMMQDSYDAVSEIYRQTGLSIGDPNVLADHVGAELCFLAVLYGRMEAEAEKAQLYRDTAERFLSEHLKNWIPQFCRDMEAAAESRFYKALARSTRDLVATA